MWNTMIFVSLLLLKREKEFMDIDIFIIQYQFNCNSPNWIIYSKDEPFIHIHIYEKLSNTEFPHLNHFGIQAQVV